MSKNSDHLTQNLSSDELRILARLTTPNKIQNFLDEIDYSIEETNRCPLQVLRDRMANCFDGAVFAAAMLSRLGYPPLILDMLPNDRDDDHVSAVYRRNDHWGAIAKSNFAGLSISRASLPHPAGTGNVLLRAILQCIAVSPLP